MFGLGLRLSARISPELSSRLLERAFLATRRHEVPEREQAWLGSAEEASLVSRGRRLAAWIWGKGEESVLLVHGWEGRGSQLGAFIAPLVGHGFRVVAFDSPGHGCSPGRRSSLVEMGEAVVDAFSQLGPFHGVIAHSAGAAATTIALRARPPLGGLVYLAPPADLGEFLARLTSRLKLPPEVTARTIGRIERRFGFRWEEIAHARLATGMTAPLLVIHDSEDREIELEQGARLAAAWPESRLEITEGLGHRRILRDENVVARAVSFLAGGSGESQEETRVARSSDASSRSSAEARTTRSFPSLFAR